MLRVPGRPFGPLLLVPHELLLALDLVQECHCLLANVLAMGPVGDLTHTVLLGHVDGLVLLPGDLVQGLVAGVLAVVLGVDALPELLADALRVG